MLLAFSFFKSVSCSYIWLIFVTIYSATKYFFPISVFWFFQYWRARQFWQQLVTGNCYKILFAFQTMADLKENSCIKQYFWVVIRNFFSFLIFFCLYIYISVYFSPQNYMENHQSILFLSIYCKRNLTCIYSTLYDLRQ